MLEPLEMILEMKTPCPDCPFRKSQSHARDANFRVVLTELANDGFARPPCKNHHAPEADHAPMCAGAVAYLVKKGKASYAMKLGFHHGIAKPEDWAEVLQDIID